MSPSILILNDRAFPGGGASKVAVTSAIGLAKRGHRVRFLGAMGPPDPGLAEAGVAVEVLGQLDLASGPRGEMAGKGLWNLEAAKKLDQLLSEENSVVHVHSWSKALSPSIFGAMRRRGARAVATLHDYGFVCPNAALHDFPTGQPCSLKPMSIACVGRNCDSRSYAHKVWRLGRQIALESVARATEALSAAICVSDFSSEVYAPHLSPTLPRIVVPNPIDVADLGPASPEDQTAFTYVGRLSREKGVLLLAEASRRAETPLICVGDGELAEQVRAINPRTLITGWVSAADVVKHIRAARAVVLPATWRETQGMVVPEALANGVPCIASSGTAPGSAIEDGQTGRLFRNGDVDDLASVLTALSKDGPAVQRMGREAYERYWSKPATLDRHLDALEQTYASLRGQARR